MLAFGTAVNRSGCWLTRFWLTLCLVLTAHVAIAADSDVEPSAVAPSVADAPADDSADKDLSTTAANDGECQVLFNHDDLKLFDFVNTRSAIDFSPYVGYRINAINYEVLPIFNPRDPDESNWLYRLANWLHVDTRDKTLHKKMIIQPGESLSLETLRENERLLRGNEYLVDSMILPQRVCGTDIDLLVVVRDIWTLSPTVTASRSGGEESTGAGVSESNLLGTGQQLSLGYFQDADRSGTVYSFGSPQIVERVNFGTTIYKNSDGDVIKYDLIRPFYQLNSTWAAGIYGLSSRSTQTITQNNVEINRYGRNIDDVEMFVGWSPGRQNDHVNRWLLGYTENIDSFDALPNTVSTPAGETIRYPWLGWSYQQDRFLTAENINRTHRQEDIQLGYAHSVRLGYASTRYGSDSNVYTFDLSMNYSAYLEPFHLISARLYSNGQGDRDEFVNTFFGGSLRYIYIINDKNRWYLSSYFDAGTNIRQDEQLTTGGLDNLRGYPNDFQRGNRRWVASAERRRFTDWHIFNLMYFGFAGYLDVGRAWDTETPGAASTDTLADIGVGIRLSPSKFRIDKVIHVDIARPLVNVDEVDSYQLIITGSVDF